MKLHHLHFHLPLIQLNPILVMIYFYLLRGRLWFPRLRWTHCHLCRNNRRPSLVCLPAKGYLCSLRRLRTPRSLSHRCGRRQPAQKSGRLLPLRTLPRICRWILRAAHRTAGSHLDSRQVRWIPFEGGPVPPLLPYFGPSWIGLLAATSESHWIPWGCRGLLS